MTRRPGWRFRASCPVLAAVVAVVALSATGVRAQATDSARTAPPIPTELASLEGRPSPTGAMLRSFVLPGWGQATYDRYLRGGVYFTGHLGNTYMIFTTLTRLDEAESREARRVAFVRNELIRDGVPRDSLEARIAADPDVRRIRGLVDARKEQREDWIALGLFWVLVSGVDAFVTAQLADFPTSLGAVYDGRRYGVVVSVPVR